MKKETVAGGENASAVRKDHKWLRRIAAAVISAVLIVSGILMLNVNVRAAVFGALSGQGNEEAKESEEGTLYGVKIGYVPDGYVAAPETDLVAFLNYGDPTIRRIEFRPEETSGIWDEPWAWEVAGSDYLYVPLIWIEIDLRGPGRLNSDPYEYPVELEEITVNGRQAYRSFPGQGIGVDEDGTLYNNVILLFDDEIVIRLQAFGFDGNETMKIAEGITW